jgi:hypothetical protein
MKMSLKPKFTKKKDHRSKSDMKQMYDSIQSYKKDKVQEFNKKQVEKTLYDPVDDSFCRAAYRD